MTTRHSNPTRADAREHKRWLSERLRAGVALVAGVLVAVLLVSMRSLWDASTAWDITVLALVAYLLVYLSVTIAAFGSATSAEIGQWARRDSRGTLLQRYVFGTAPGPGASLFIATVALAVAVLWLPQPDTSGLRGGARFCVAVALVAIAWLSVLVSFAVTFHADNIVESGAALQFPGTDDPSWSDYVYFAMSVMTTFGTTDVNVQSTRMRQTVAFNSGIAFVFNTVTVATVVAAIKG